MYFESHGPSGLNFLLLAIIKQHQVKAILLALIRTVILRFHGIYLSVYSEFLFPLFCLDTGHLVLREFATDCTLGLRRLIIFFNELLNGILSFGVGHIEIHVIIVKPGRFISA